MSAATDQWFEESCRPTAEKALTTLAKERIAKARERESQRLKRAAAKQKTITESDICEVEKARIQRKVSHLVDRKCPSSGIGYVGYVPFRDASLTDWFETELFSILERGGRELVRCEVAIAGQRFGGHLPYVEVKKISHLTSEWVKKLWHGAGGFLGAEFLAVGGLNSNIDSTLVRLENAVYDEAHAAARDLANPQQAGELPASTQRTVAEESRSAAPPAETGATLPRRGYIIQGIAKGAMGGSVIDSIQSWVEEADCRTLVKLCKAIDPEVEEVDVFECVETYILERFDNVAVGFLEIVTGTQTIDEYMAILKEWCDSVLPALERDFKVDEAAVRGLVYEATVPRLVDEATFRRIEEVVGTTGRIMGSVDMRKLAERAAEWNAKAISRARGIETGLSRIHSKRLQGAKTRDCLRAAYDLYPSGLDVLTEEFLSRAVPGFVFGAAVDHKWVRYPPIRPTGETISQNELTETFGGHRVPSGYGASFTRNLESRIAYWRVEATRRESAQPSPPRRTNTGKSNSGDRRAAVDAYIQEVKNAGKQITRTDIWRKAGYKSRTEFERWERNDPNRLNKAADKNFTRILIEKPHLT
jgi:hypothetical protein